MPIHLPYRFPRLTSEEFGEIDYRVMNHVFASHHELGRLADETVYQGDLADRLDEAKLTPSEREIPIHVSFDSFSKTYLVDLVVTRQAIYELKTVARLTKQHESQLLNYLLLTESTRGKLVNFRPVSVESRFVNANATLDQRRKFRMVNRAWDAPNELTDLLLSLLSDWGAGLSIELYRQAIVHLLGGDEVVVKQLPIVRGERQIGSQRFRMVSDNEAIAMTAYKTVPANYASHFRRLIRYSPVSAIHCVNIQLETVTMMTVQAGS